MSKGLYTIAGALAGAYVLSEISRGSTGATVAGAVVGGVVGARIGESAETKQLANKVERLQLLEEKERVERSLAALEADYSKA